MLGTKPTQRVNLQGGILSQLINVVKYISPKYPKQSLNQIQSKLLNGESFDIQGQGNDVDTKIIQQILNQNEFYQKPSQKQLKDQAVNFLSYVICKWSQKLAQQQIRIHESQLQNYTAKLLPFGSYVLGLKANSSDLDFICVCPKFINRQDHFFQKLSKILREKPQIKDLTILPKAKVPIITFLYKDIQVDISFCQLQTQTVPRDIQKNISIQLLNSVKDQQSKTSLLGRKNNLMIMDIVSRSAQNFRQALRFVKVWSKNRGISSNSTGYLGGISWAIMMAKICQIFPNHKPNRLLYQFFNIYSLWNWNIPIRICRPTLGQLPQISEDKKPMMQVITPASQYNSTQKVNYINFRIIQQQIKLANQIFKSKKDLTSIPKKIDFFSWSNIFIQLDVCGMTGQKVTQKQFKQWQGLVQSRIIRLTNALYRFHKKQIQQGKIRIFPFPKFFKKNCNQYPSCNAMFFGVNLNQEVSQAQMNFSKAVRDWCINLDKVKPNSDNFTVRIFQTFKDEMTDVETSQNKKLKQTKEDPRIALLKKKQKEQKS